MSTIFSIIIPSYNAESTIGAALESIHFQAFHQYEVLVIDGLSSDGTVSIVEEWSRKDPKVKCISEKDNGIYDAMNKGVKLATGDWFLFLGADDRLYANDTLEKVTASIKRKPDSKIFYGDVLTSEGYVQKYNNYTFERLVQTNICHQSIFYHKSLFTKKCYNLAYKVFADWDFNLRVFNRMNAPVYLEQTISFFSLEGTSKDWTQHPEYIKHFSNPSLLKRKYGGATYLLLDLVKKMYKRILTS